jgi:predicted nucleic acid-binding protein
VKFVLDTNAVSEMAKPKPNQGLVEWHLTQDPADLFITTVTLAEVWEGFHSLDPSHREYDRVKQFASGLDKLYRVLNFDRRAAAVWGEIVSKANGLLPLRDSFIAAIVCSRGHRIVTRDEAPFQRMGCKVINPWQ